MLQDTYHVQHFMLDPPKQLFSAEERAEKGLIEQLNRVTYRVGSAPEDGLQHHAPFCSQNSDKRDSAGARESPCDSLVIQKVRKLPKAAFFVGCGGGEGKKMNATLTEWETSDWQSTVTNKKAFLETLELEILKLTNVMEQEPMFWYDFQVFLDSTGRLYHLDFDRITQGHKQRSRLGERSFRQWAKQVRDACLGLLHTMKQDVMESTSNTAPA